MTRSCPDEELLIDYIEGRLTPAQKDQIDEHLSDCEECLQEYVISRSIVRGDEKPSLEPVPARVTQNAISMIKSQVFFTAKSPVKKSGQQLRRGLFFLSEFLRDTFQWRWPLAQVRSSPKMVTEDFFQTKKHFYDFEANIEIEKTGNKKTNIKVFLADNSSRKGLRVTLKVGEREISSQLLTPGYVLFEDLSFGPYKLDFSENGKIYGTYSFEIK